MELLVTNVQPFSLHDGPGIRTAVFLAGCPLRCLWCHNPEAQSAAPVLAFEREKCLGCGACGACPSGAHSFRDGHEIDRSRCTRCGLCVSVCPAKALSFTVRPMAKEEFLRVAARQKRICGETGGVTFSGGEPLAQGETVLRLLEETDVRAAMETCGEGDGELFGRMIRRMELVMFDLKLADPELHRRYTGRTNERILQNLGILRRSGTPFVLRTPLIPGITDTEENLRALGEIAGSDPWEKLPYNPMTPAKYERLGLPYRIPPAPEKSVSRRG